jgi:hypothetical protein
MRKHVAVSLLATLLALLPLFAQKVGAAEHGRFMKTALAEHGNVFQSADATCAWASRNVVSRMHVPEPALDHRHVDVGSDEVHSGRVTERVRCEVLLE